MTQVWILVVLIVVIIAGGVGVALAITRWLMPPDDEMPERWRKDSERDRGKQ